MEGWLVSSGLTGCIVGVIVTGFISDRIGRKKTIRLAAIMFLLSALGCAFAPGIAVVIAARMLGGIGVGMASVISPMPITEFAAAGNRGKMVSYYQLAITVGVLLAYFSNALIANYAEKGTAGWFSQEQSWRPMFLVMAIPSLIFTWMLSSIPESPRWLITNAKDDDAAKKILGDIRTPTQAAADFNDIKNAAVNNIHTETIFTKAMRLPLLIGIVLAVLQQFPASTPLFITAPAYLSQQVLIAAMPWCSSLSSV